MLQKLHIQNYAIIDELQIVFSPQLNIITGETGAGKSILMGALSLILGERADSSMSKQKDKKCFVEGSFAPGLTKNIRAFFKENDLDLEEEIVIRREISAQGKSRAFINDTPVTIAQLQRLSNMLVDLHQQFDTLALGETDFQLEVIDALTGNEKPLQEYQDVYHQWKARQAELSALQEQKNQFNKELDYHQFLYNELDELSLSENELENLEAELKLLSNSENIKAALTKVYFDLKEAEQPVVQQLKMFIQQLQHYTEHHTGIPSIIERLQAAQIELNDIAGEVETISDKMLYDPQRIEVINDRMAAGYKLLKKHNVQTTKELLDIQASLQNKLQAVLNIDEAILSKEKETTALFEQVTALAAKLSAKRKAATQPFEKQVNALLVQVGMPNARLRVDINQQASLQSTGADDIEFLFDANKSNHFAPVRKVASGGELSRLMLSIKSLVARSIDLPTMIFDEIDTGISGEVAKQVGVIMKDLAKTRQVICITHQPQIAGKADAHFYVYKEMIKDKIQTNIRILNKDERINTIAQMLGGEKPSAAALANAKEIVN